VLEALESTAWASISIGGIAGAGAGAAKGLGTAAREPRSGGGGSSSGGSGGDGGGVSDDEWGDYVRACCEALFFASCEAELQRGSCHASSLPFARTHVLADLMVCGALMQGRPLTM
jgi:hypothetical protein